jgi:hypothetical protein
MACHKITAADFALALELHNEGCLWKVIAYGLGVPTQTLKGIRRRAEKDGMAIFKSPKTSKQHHTQRSLLWPKQAQHLA